MKKLFTICLLLILLVGKVNAQTQFPFYGFELSNYEVGDTLEYFESSYNASLQISCSGYSLYLINNKQIFSDSIKYVIKKIHSGSCTGNQLSFNESYIDTLSLPITNDTIYNNNNNILQNTLFKFDTINIGTNLDSAYVKYDTINGLKRLRLECSAIWLDSGYFAIQNIGIIEMHFSAEDKWLATLNYARLAHYGIYGTYDELFDGLKEAFVSISNTSIRYDNNENPFLLLSSSQNLNNPILSIYDLLGRNVKTQQVNTGSNLIDMQALPKGIYLYKVESNGNVLGQGKLMNMTN